MIVDPSALVAILKREAGYEVFLDRLIQAASDQTPIRMATASAFEFGMVIDRLNDQSLSRKVDLLIAQFRIQGVDVTASHAELARVAYARFGKGNHPARLNFGDCFAYALARETGEHLLFKGEDFSQTDIISAV